MIARARPPILAIDQATRLGWAFLPAGAERPESGVVQLPGDGATTARIRAFRSWLDPRVAPLGAGQGLLVYEGPGLVAGRAAPFRVGCHLESVLLDVAAEWGAQAVVITAGELKAHATGKGNADKAAVTAAMRARWARPDLEDDNEADALALLSAALAAWERGELELRQDVEAGDAGAA